MSMASTELASVIRQRVAETERELVALKDALSVLDERQAQDAPQQLKPAQLKRDVRRLVTVEGVRSTDIAERTGAPQSRVLALLKELEADGQVRRHGTRRSTRWLRR